ncbi:MAG: 50S ribosomal protein L22 [Acidimicrobiales bacterium]
MARAYGVKTNEGAHAATHEPGERPGTRATVKYARLSAYKARAVLDEIRGRDVQDADDVLRYSPRDAAITVRKCLRSAVANAQNNDGLDPDTLYVSACYADEGMTIKRWRPRARGRATRIRKRTTHVTVIVSPLSPEEVERREATEAARVAGGGPARARTAAAARAARVAKSREKEQAAEDIEELEPEADSAPIGAEVTPSSDEAEAEAESEAEPTDRDEEEE